MDKLDVGRLLIGYRELGEIKWGLRILESIYLDKINLGWKFRVFREMENWEKSWYIDLREFG
jgi:hypothetical protein